MFIEVCGLSDHKDTLFENVFDSLPTLAEATESTMKDSKFRPGAYGLILAKTRILKEMISKILLLLPFFGPYLVVSRVSQSTSTGECSIFEFPFASHDRPPQPVTI